MNNCDQFAADLVDGFAERSVEHLCLHVQRRVDGCVTDQLRDDLCVYARLRPFLWSRGRMPSFFSLEARVAALMQSRRLTRSESTGPMRVFQLSSETRLALGDPM